MKRFLLAAIAISLLTSIVGDLVSDELKHILQFVLGSYYRPILYILFVSLVLLTLYFEWCGSRPVCHTQPPEELDKTPEPSGELGKTPEPYQPTQEEHQQFKAFWPKLSATLARDLQESLQSTIVARNAATANTPPHLVDTHNPKVRLELTDNHWKILSKCHPDLFQALTKYLKASECLGSAAHRYRQFGYPGGIQNGDLDSAKREMHRAARELEDATDHLDSQVRYYNSVYGTSE